MVTEAIMNAMAGLFGTVVSWLQSILPSPPGFWTDMTTALNTVFVTIPGAVSYFVPIGPVIAAALLLFALYPPLILVRLSRRLLSLFTGGGGGG